MIFKLYICTNKTKMMKAITLRKKKALTLSVTILLTKIQNFILSTTEVYKEKTINSNSFGQQVL